MPFDESEIEALEAIYGPDCEFISLQLLEQQIRQQVNIQTPTAKAIIKKRVVSAPTLKLKFDTPLGTVTLMIEFDNIKEDDTTNNEVTNNKQTSNIGYPFSIPSYRFMTNWHLASVGEGAYLDLPFDLKHSIDTKFKQVFEEYKGEVFIHAWAEELRMIFEDYPFDTLPASIGIGYGSTSTNKIIDNDTDVGDDARKSDLNTTGNNDIVDKKTGQFDRDASVHYNPSSTTSIQSSSSSVISTENLHIPNNLKEMNIKNNNSNIQIYTSTEPITDRKSVFIGHCIKVHSQEQVERAMKLLFLQDKKIAKATHNISAYRVELPNGFTQDNCDDDGETAAGGRLLHLLQLLDVKNCLVVVSRWYGGIQLGPVRFKHINNAARNVLQEYKFI